MCLVFVAYHAHPRYPLVVAANRDEYHGRASATPRWWDDAPDVFAGRDLEAGGTWMGVTRSGRFAAITNYRDAKRQREGRPSRGHITSGFLDGEDSMREFLKRLAEDGRHYNPFSFLAFDGTGLGWCSNRIRGFHVLDPGIYGLSNHLLDTPWPKVSGGKSALAALVDGDALGVSNLLALLDDREPAPDDRLPNTGVGADRERWLSPRFIVGGAYGTRSSSVLLVDAAGTVRFVERAFDAHGATVGQITEEFTITSDASASAVSAP